MLFSRGIGRRLRLGGEISIVRAKPHSREVERNEIGVEFQIRLSDKELSGYVSARKFDNATVILEVRTLFSPVNDSG